LLSEKESGTEFDPKKTAVGCPECGYPIRISDQRCPNCDNPLAPDEFKPPRFASGTVIQGVGNPEKPIDGKKLVGFLVTYTQTPSGDFFPVYEGRNYIGRDSSTNICLPKDEQISGKHLSILYRPIDRKFKFKDEQSSNGTFVNEKLIDEGELKNFDTIRIGSTKLLFIEIPQF
jgi:hypothetical protein